MKKCCEQNHDSRYCPDCGTKLQNHPLYELLEHCKLRLKDQTTRLESLTEYCRNKPDEYTKRRLGRQKRSIAKWQGWVDALQELEVIKE